MQKNPSEDAARPSTRPRPSARETVGLRGRLKAIARAPGDALTLAAVLLVGGFFLLWRIDQLPPNIVDEPLGGAITAWVVTYQKDVIASTIRAIQASSISGLLDLSAVSKSSLDWFTAWGYLYLYPLAYPLGVAVAAASFWIFGASLAVFAGISGVAGLLSVFFLYLLGRRMYDPWTGMFGALFLASSFYLLNYLRGPVITMSISLGVLLAVLFMYLLYKASETRRMFYWWLIGIVGGLALFNGWMVFLLLPAIGLSFLVLNADWLAVWRRLRRGWRGIGYKDASLLRLCARGPVTYVAALALALGFGALLTVVWSLFLGLDAFASLKGIYQVSIQHRASSVSLGSAGARWENARYLWNSVFASDNIMEPGLKYLMVLGMGVCLWKRSPGDRLLLSWVLVGLGAFAFAITLGAPYYLITVFPAFCLAAARPLAAALKLGSGPPHNKGGAMVHTAALLLLAALTSAWLIWTGAKTYDQYFVKQQALGFSADYSQIARLLESASPTEPAAIVYPDYIADMPFEVAFHFTKKPLPFRWFSWRSGEDRRKPPWFSFNTFEPEGVAQWERFILSRYPSVFYVVPRDETWFRECFQKLHPGLTAVKTVEPVIRLDIYQVTTPTAVSAAGWAEGQLLTTGPGSKSAMSFRSEALLSNGSFEEWDGSLPKGWQVYSVIGGNPALSATRESRNGGMALTIGPIGLGQSIFQDFTAEKGVKYFASKTLTFGVWAKSKDPHGKMYLQFRADNSGTMRYRVFDITPTYDFYAVTLDNAPAASSGYRVEITAGDDSHFNEITVDDAVLLEGPNCWDGYCSERDVTATLKKTTFAKGHAGQAPLEPQAPGGCSAPQVPAPAPALAPAVPVPAGEGYRGGSSSEPDALTTAANLLQNPSFELWNSDLEADAWRSFYSTPEPLGLSRETNSHSGQYAVRLKPSGLSQALYQDFTQQKGVDYFIGKKVTFGLWARSAAPTGVMRLHMRRDDNYTEKIEHFRLTNEYQFFSMTVDKLSEATTGYRVEIIPGNEQANNDILVDDAVLALEEN